MKKTSLYEIHKQLGAKLIPFAGFEMPIQYKSIIEEYFAVRNSVGVFDVSHMGEIEIKGKDAFDFVQYLTTNDISKLESGKVQYSSMCYENGGIVDDILVYSFGRFFQIVVNASNIEKDFNWMKEIGKNFDIEITNKSDEISLLAIQGKNSLNTLQKVFDIDLSTLKFYTFTKTKFLEKEILISRTGYTGELGFELYFPSEKKISEEIWNKIFECGKEFNIQPIGLAARDLLRLEMGYCLYGNDISEEVNPVEASLDWITKFQKEFVGKNTIENSIKSGIGKKLVALKFNGEKVFPRNGYEIFKDNIKIGKLTSGIISPILNSGIALGFVHTNFSTVGNEVDVLVRTKFEKAKIVELPFVERNPR